MDAPRAYPSRPLLSSPATQLIPVRSSSTLRFSVLFVLTVSLAACATTKRPRAQVRYLGARYDIALVEVERPAEVKQRWGATQTIQLGDSARYVYEDSLLRSGIALATPGIALRLTNKTSHSIKIVWDESSFIDAKGAVSKVMHLGVKYADRNASQPPSVVPARQTISEEISPNDRVHYREGFYGAYNSRPGGWEHRPILPVGPWTVTLTADDSLPLQSPQTEAIRTQVNGYVGKRLGLVLPLEIQGVTNEYTFWFEVKSARIEVLQPTTR